MLVDLDYERISLPSLDESVTVEVRALEVWAYQQVLAVLRPVMEQAGLSREEAEAAASGQASQATQEGIAQALAQLGNEEVGRVAGLVLPAHCRNLQGLEIRIEGTERSATVEDLPAHGLFLPTVLELLATLFTRSQLTRGDQGNSARPSRSSSGKAGSRSRSGGSRATR